MITYYHRLISHDPRSENGNKVTQNEARSYKWSFQLHQHQHLASSSSPEGSHEAHVGGALRMYPYIHMGIHDRIRFAVSTHLQDFCRNVALHERDHGLVAITVLTHMADNTRDLLKAVRKTRIWWGRCMCVCSECGWGGTPHMAPWFTVIPQPAILLELLCILWAEGCAVDVFRRPVVQIFLN